MEFLHFVQVSPCLPNQLSPLIHECLYPIRNQRTYILHGFLILKIGLEVDIFSSQVYTLFGSSLQENNTSDYEDVLWSSIVVTLCPNSLRSGLKWCAPIVIGVWPVMIVRNVGVFVDRFIQ